jgi:hypothetical protein
MARTYYPGGEIIVATGAGSPAALTLNPAAEFEVYSAESGGTEHTDLLAADGTTPLPVAGSGKPFCDSNGKPPGLYGPDGVTGVLWRAIGSVRYPMYPSAAISTMVAQGARKDIANTFAAAQTFSSAVAFSATPTISGQNLTTATTVASHMAVVSQIVAFLNATGQPYVLYVNPSTGVWPNSGARVHSTGVAMTGFTGQWIWDSQGYVGAAAPSGAIDGDLWDERVA